MAPRTNICVTVLWTPGITLIRPVSQLSGGINSEPRLVVRFGRNTLSSLRITRGFARIKASPPKFLFPRLRSGKAHFVQSRNPDPAVARRTRFPEPSTLIQQLELIRQS